MTRPLPRAGYLSLPLVFQNGALKTTTLEGSIEAFLRLNLNVPLQKVERPAWLPADPEIGCRVPHYDFQSVVRTLNVDVSQLITSIRETILATDSRVLEVEVDVRDLPSDDPARKRKDGNTVRGPMKSVAITCARADGKSQTATYAVAFGGPGPVFDED